MSHPSEARAHTQTDAFASFAAVLRPHLAEVETLINEELSSDLACVRTLTSHLERFRGKMLRPVLVLLSGEALAPVGRTHHVLAAVAEMIHLSTLVHDDVLDSAEMRRRGATINYLKGNEAAVILGDYLISHAFHLCSSLDSQAASRRFGATTNEICEGELLQLHNRGRLDLDETTYWRIVAGKTGALCEVCCELGASAAGGSPEVAQSLARYGRLLGSAFQVQDDVLDVTGQPESVGKSLRTDVLQIKLTLPLIHFLATAPQEHRDLLRSLLSGDAPDKGEQVRNLLLPSPSLAYAQAKARERVAEAKDLLLCLPPGRARDMLAWLADSVVRRDR